MLQSKIALDGSVLKKLRKLFTLPVMVIVYVVLSVVEDETLKLLAGVIYFQSAVSAFVIFVTFPALSIVVTGFWPVVVVVATVTV